jgi:hypothetical protein
VDQSVDQGVEGVAAGVGPEVAHAVVDRHLHFRAQPAVRLNRDGDQVEVRGERVEHALMEGPHGADPLSLPPSRKSWK